MAVYIIRSGPFGDVKIGSATDPLARLRQLQTSSSTKLRFIRVLEGGQIEEARLHKRFAHIRKSGEWFAATDEILSGDLGLTELSIPRGKRDYSSMWRNQSTAQGRFYQLVDDLHECIGDRVQFARDLGVAPWRVENAYQLRDKSILPAAVLFARQRGAPITLQYALTMMADSESEAAAAAEAKAKAPNQWDAKREQEWMQARGETTIWWDRFTESAPAEPAHEVAAQ